MGLRYQVACEDGTLIQGFGQTVNLSSSGFLFRPADQLPLGSAIEAELDWPGVRRGARLAFRIAGATVRRHRNCIAVSIQKGAFRTLRPDATVIEK